jgi:hypothetical protein
MRFDYRMRRARDWLCRLWQCLSRFENVDDWRGEPARRQDRRSGISALTVEVIVKNAG